MYSRRFRQSTRLRQDRNWAIVRKTKDKVAYKADEGKVDQLNKQPNKDILDHVRKRKVEVKCAELADILEEQGFTSEEVKKKVESYRSMLMGTEIKPAMPRDEFGRVNVRDSHQIAEAQQEKNLKLREAFGISEFFVEGSSLDPERHAKEAEARAAATNSGKIYELVRTPSPLPDTTSCPERKKRKQPASRRKKGKKRRKERSESPRIVKKKEKSKRKKKEKKHRKIEASSSESDSSEDSDDSSSSTEAVESRRRKRKKKKRSRTEARGKHEKKKPPAKRKRQSSDSSTDSSPERPRKAQKQERLQEKPKPVTTQIPEDHHRSPRRPQEKFKPVTPRRKCSSPLKRLERKEKTPLFRGRGTSPRTRGKSPWRVRRSPSTRRRRNNRRSTTRSRSRSRFERYESSRRRSRSGRRSSRRRSKSSRRSTLSYSPVRKNPERYREILEEKRKKEGRQNQEGRGKERSKSNTRRSQVVAPRVSLRSSSEEETELCEEEPKQEDEERIKELNTLKRLQSGLAAKARETIGKKVISPVKVKMETNLDITLPKEPAKIEKKSSSFEALCDVRSEISSRSPSPALPLTREEAEMKIRSPTESPPIVQRVSSPGRLTISGEEETLSPRKLTNLQMPATAKLRSPNESLTSVTPSSRTKVRSKSPSQPEKHPKIATRKKSSSRSVSESSTGSRSMEKSVSRSRSGKSSPRKDLNSSGKIKKADLLRKNQEVDLFQKIQEADQSQKNREADRPLKTLETGPSRKSRGADRCLKNREVDQLRKIQEADLRRKFREADRFPKNRGADQFQKNRAVDRFPKRAEADRDRYPGRRRREVEVELELAHDLLPVQQGTEAEALRAPPAHLAVVPIAVHPAAPWVTELPRQATHHQCEKEADSLPPAHPNAALLAQQLGEQQAHELVEPEPQIHLLG
ncbi:hypothetical protein KM043_013376 [Ampulex compressa]|nr:hypothetical protein KM043_013376 [Ampulex compressa]